MPKSFLFGFVDLAFLTTALFWYAAHGSQEVFEETDLPVSYALESTGALEAEEDLQILTIRWFGPGALPARVTSRYEGTAEEAWVGLEGPFSDTIWRGETLYPAVPKSGFRSCIRRGRPDLYWKAARIVESRPCKAPVLIRADRLLPFKYIVRMFEVLSRDRVGDHFAYLAVALAPPH